MFDILAAASFELVALVIFFTVVSLFGDVFAETIRPGLDDESAHCTETILEIFLHRLSVVRTGLLGVLLEIDDGVVTDFGEESVEFVLSFDGIVFGDWVLRVGRGVTERTLDWIFFSNTSVVLDINGDLD